MARCDVCGRHYDELRFQVVHRRTAQAFDRVECAFRAYHALAVGDAGEAALSARARHVLDQLERTAAELFMARAQLESERRHRLELEERTVHLAGERDGLARELELRRTSWRSLFRLQRRCPAS